MQDWTYPAVIERWDTGNGETYLVSFPDFPQALTEGASFEAARGEAPDALAAAAEAYLARGLPFPAPREAEAGEVAIPLDPALAARAALATTMKLQDVSKVALAQRMGRNEKTIRRLLQPRGASLDLVMEALRTLGARPVLSFQADAAGAISTQADVAV